MNDRDPERMGMTRRQLAGALLATGAAAAQTPLAPSAAPSTPAGELQAAQAQNQHTAEALAKVQVPMSAEPAFHFNT